MSAERELEQLRASFATERSALENDLGKARRAYALLAERYSEMGREFEAAKEDLLATAFQLDAAKEEIARLRRKLDEACSGEKELDGPVHVALPPVERFERRLGDYCPSPVDPPAPRPPILRCSQCDSQVGPSHWSRDGERRCEKCGPFEPRDATSAAVNRAYWEQEAERVRTERHFRAVESVSRAEASLRHKSTARCETCGTAKLVADDECSWCGPGAHKP